MKKIKRIIKNLIVIIIIMMTTLINLAGPVSAGYTSSEVGGAVAGFAIHEISEFGQEGKNIVGYRQIVGDKYDNADHGGVAGHDRNDNPIWSPNEYKWGDYIYFDCSSFATGCYHYVAGIFSYALCTDTMVVAPDSELTQKFDSRSWDKSENMLKVGDLMAYDGHAWLYVGNGKGFGENGRYFQGATAYTDKAVTVFTIKESAAKELTSLNTEFSVAGTAQRTGTQIDYSNFFFNGIPDGKYSLASADTLWDIVVEALKGMWDYLVGYLTYIIRIIIVGITSLFDKLLNNAVQSLNNATPKSLMDSGVTATDIKDDKSEDRAVTIESLVFDQLELLDVNIFE